jgi:hypothetical protein
MIANESKFESKQELKDLYPNQLQIIDKQIIGLPLITYKYWDFDDQTIKSWFSGVPNNGWRSSPSIKFFSVLSPYFSHKFLRFITSQLTQFDLFFSEGRTQFLVFISEREFNYMNAKPSINMHFYRSATVLYNSLFDIEVLETFPYNEFGCYPIRQTKSRTKKRVSH